MDDGLRGLAAQQYDLVAAWQLRTAGWTQWMIDHRVQTHGWRVVHRGVYALNKRGKLRCLLGLSALVGELRGDHPARNGRPKAAGEGAGQGVPDACRRRHAPPR